MASSITKLPTLKCKRCGAEWIPRQVTPKQCPVCKSYRWNTATKIQIEKKNIEVSEKKSTTHN
jgi:predicted Zn-ribbon and HTH transcriptional regulator